MDLSFRGEHFLFLVHSTRLLTNTGSVTCGLHGFVRVGKDRQSWQELECYLFGEMLICVKEKKSGQAPIISDSGQKLSRCTLKGSILIKKHLKQVQAVPGKSSA